MLNHQELQLFRQPRPVTYLLKFRILPGVTGNWDQGISQWFKEKSVPDSEEKYLQDAKIFSVCVYGVRLWVASNAFKN